MSLKVQLNSYLITLVFGNSFVRFCHYYYYGLYNLYQVLKIKLSVKSHSKNASLFTWSSRGQNSSENPQSPQRWDVDYIIRIIAVKMMIDIEKGIFCQPLTLTDLPYLGSLSLSWRSWTPCMLADEYNVTLLLNKEQLFAPVEGSLNTMHTQLLCKHLQQHSLFPSSQFQYIIYSGSYGHISLP